MRFEASFGLSEGTQLEDAIAFRIYGITDHSQPTSKRILKSLAVFQLHSKSPLPIAVRGLPLIDGGRDRDALGDLLRGCQVVTLGRLYSGRIELPLGDEAVGRQPAL